MTLRRCATLLDAESSKNAQHDASLIILLLYMTRCSDARHVTGPSWYFDLKILLSQSHSPVEWRSTASLVAKWTPVGLGSAEWSPGMVSLASFPASNKYTGRRRSRKWRRPAERGFRLAKVSDVPGLERAAVDEFGRPGTRGPCRGRRAQRLSTRVSSDKIRRPCERSVAAATVAVVFVAVGAADQGSVVEGPVGWGSRAGKAPRAGHDPPHKITHELRRLWPDQGRLGPPRGRGGQRQQRGRLRRPTGNAVVLFPESFSSGHLFKLIFVSCRIDNRNYS